MAKITLNDIMATLTQISDEIAKTNKRVTVLEKTVMKASTPASAGKGTSKKTSTKSTKKNASSMKKGKGNAQPKVVVKLADFEPKGKLAKGKRTRNPKKGSKKFIVERRKK